MTLKPSTARAKLLAEMGKKFKEGKFGTLTGAESAVKTIIPTGINVLDNWVLGVGGLPTGRVTEVYSAEGTGKTSLAFQVLAAAQKAGGLAIMAETEGRLQPERAMAFGCDIEEVLLDEPDSMEDLYEHLEHLLSKIPAGVGPNVIVWDSIGGTATRKELEGKMQPGDAARLLHRMKRTLPKKLLEKNCHLFLINQQTEKIGVMFGDTCFRYDTMVELADGSTRRIGQIVNGKESVLVRTFDPHTETFGVGRVTDWHKKGPTDEWVEVTTDSGKVRATPNHWVFRHNQAGTLEEVQVGNLEVGDMMVAHATAMFNDDQMAMAKAQILGDGSVRSSGKHTVELRFAHGAAQTAYAQWKESVFGELCTQPSTRDDGSYHCRVRPSADLLGVEDGPHLIEEMGLKGLAVWCMDDGTLSGSYDQWGHGKFEISVKRWDGAAKQAGADALKRLLGVRPTVQQNGYLFSGERTKALFEAVLPYWSKTMDYKVPPKYRRLIGSHEWSTQPSVRLLPVPSIVRNLEKVQAKSGQRERFDITVEGDHTYVAGGVVVHNTTTTGGSAMKFAATFRLQLTKGAQFKVGLDKVGHRVKVKAIKNSLAPEARSATIALMYEDGFDNDWTDYQHAIDRGLVPSSMKLDAKGIARARAALEQAWNGNGNQLIEEDSEAEAEPETT